MNYGPHFWVMTIFENFISWNLVPPFDALFMGQRPRMAILPSKLLFFVPGEYIWMNETEWGVNSFWKITSLTMSAAINQFLKGFKIGRILFIFMSVNSPWIALQLFLPSKRLDEAFSRSVHPKCRGHLLLLSRVLKINCDWTLDRIGLDLKDF